MPVTNDARVLVDWRTADDAGVYRIDDRRALVQTVDFFTPIVDDAATYGRIAAANALSDVYAMGARPLTALAVAAFPNDADRAVLGEIFRGGFEMLQEAGVALLGGHTVQDQEIKFGYAITGEVDPADLWANAGARPGDVILLTKPVGTGVIATAIKFGRLPDEIAAPAIASMLQLNRGAAEGLRSLPRGSVHACTDVTGFGVIGHATEMARASNCTIAIDVGSVPLLPGVLALIDANTPGGARTNQDHFGGSVLVGATAADPPRVRALYDPQTSGGLLVAVAPDAADAARAAISRVGAGAWAIGRVEPPSAVALRLH
jgi:selenide,water dikinase